MPEIAFAQRGTDHRGLSCWEAGAGETIVAVIGRDEQPTRAHALLAEHRRVIVFATADAERPKDMARSIVAELATLGIGHVDLMAEGAGAAVALQLALLPDMEIGTIVLAAPDGPADAAFREVKQPVLSLQGTNDGSDAAARYREMLPGGHFMLVYDAGQAIGAERPEALAFIAAEFFERRDLFLVSRESGRVLP